MQQGREHIGLGPRPNPHRRPTSPPSGSIFVRLDRAAEVGIESTTYRLQVLEHNGDHAVYRADDLLQLLRGHASAYAAGGLPPRMIPDARRRPPPCLVRRARRPGATGDAVAGVEDRRDQASRSPWCSRTGRPALCSQVLGHRFEHQPAGLLAGAPVAATTPGRSGSTPSSPSRRRLRRTATKSSIMAASLESFLSVEGCSLLSSASTSRSVCRHGDQARLGGVRVVTVRAGHTLEYPAILLQQPEDLADLHRHRARPYATCEPRRPAAAGRHLRGSTRTDAVPSASSSCEPSRSVAHRRQDLLRFRTTFDLKTPSSSPCFNPETAGQMLSRRSGSNRRPTAYKVKARRRSCCLPADTSHQRVAVVPHVYPAERISCHEWCHATQMRPNTRLRGFRASSVSTRRLLEAAGGLWSAPSHSSAQGAQVTVDLRGMSVGADQRAGAVVVGFAEEVDGAAGDVVKGTRTVVSGTGYG